jgi:hypothetical protein
MNKEIKKHTNKQINKEQIHYTKRERLKNILKYVNIKICYERDTLHGARQPKVKKLNYSNKYKLNKIKKERKK